MSEVDVLDPLTLPLRGSRLIEASAGTGKTWTIAALYLRLVLGHGAAGHAFVRPLVPSEILVMTFTKAATRELSDRIRQRLVHAAACFRGEAVPKPDDAFLQRLLAEYAETSARSGAAWRLALAAQAMDDAAIHTIDSWVQRMLREHAFDSGSPFDEELLPDEATLRAQATRDYWRQEVYPLEGDELRIALDVWPTLDRLDGTVRALKDAALPAAAGDAPLGEQIARLAAQRQAELTALKAPWTHELPVMRTWLQDQLARRDCPLNRAKLRSDLVAKWLDALQAWVDEPLAAEMGLTPTARHRLTPDGMAEALKDGATLEWPSCFERFASTLAALARLPDLASALHAHAACRVQRRLRALKEQAASFGFADMLDRLDQALDETAHGAHAHRLRSRILAQYPVALVDEFQDTSPVQLRIFDRLYAVGSDDASRALLMIGDPKQSIYAFRGADIHGYLRVRRATRGRHHALGTNHRSTQSLVAAINHLFGRAEDRGGGGAFAFDDADPQGQVVGGPSGLPFVPVQAKGRDERLLTAQGEPAAITLCLDIEPLRVGESRARLAALCAERIVALLDDEQAAFVDDNPEAAAGVGGVEPTARPASRRVRPCDVAVLVRTGREATAVRSELRRRGVASVFLSDKDSVFASDEAPDLLRLLRAMAAPTSVPLARAALSTALLGLPLDELLTLADDDEAFDARCEVLRQLGVAWQTQGVLAAVRRALHALDLPARWLAGPDGERRLTNVMHLAERLQAASSEVEGEQALLRWMQQQMDDAQAGQGGGDEQVLRLESDADLVQVVTVHKSKGLEYPIVFLPFPCHFRAVDAKRQGFVEVRDAHGNRRTVLHPTTEQALEADEERLREDLRLLYVALTRARHRVWVGLATVMPNRGNASTWHRSAIGRLLSGSTAQSPAQIGEQVAAAVEAGRGLALEATGLMAGATPAVTRLRRTDASMALAPASPYDASFDRAWTVTSYSAIVRGAAADDGRSVREATGDIDAAQEATLEAATLSVIDPVADEVSGEGAGPRWRDDEPAADEESPAVAVIAAKRDDGAAWHRFPRGAWAGNFLHEQLEWLADEGFALDASPPLQQAFVRRCERKGWGHRADDALAWLRRVCTTPLPPLGVALAGLDGVLPEMEFWMPLDALPVAALDRLCRQHLLPGRPRPALSPRVLRGLLMGFADLVFVHRGRYGVLDYKSNALGDRDADYSAGAMAAAMLEHRYDVQAALYLLALHRLLRSRLGDGYAPSQHLHGATYCFLRGVAADGAGVFHLEAPQGLLPALDALLAPTAAGDFA